MFIMSSVTAYNVVHVFTKRKSISITNNVSLTSGELEKQATTIFFIYRKDVLNIP